MKPYLLLPLCALLMSSFALSFTQLSFGSDPQIVRVPGDYSTIQQAVNVAPSGSVVLVSSGVYHEHVMANKSLQLIGNDRTNTIIDSDNNGTAITVMADNVVIDGFTLCNSSYPTTGTKAAIHIVGSNNCTVRNNILTHNACFGIYLERSNNSNISENLASFNGGSIEGDLGWGGGIGALESDYSLMQRNIIVGSLVDAIYLSHCNNTLVTENTIADCDAWGIDLSSSNSNRFYLNNIFNATTPVSVEFSSGNVWNDGTRGNYWDTYTGLDDGSNGHIAGDGIGDTDLPHQAVDNYPLVRPLGTIPIIWENKAYNVTLDGNSTFSAFRFVQIVKEITFDALCPSNTTGYFNITIPKSLLQGNFWTITLNGPNVSQQAVIYENQTHASIYLAYSSSYQRIRLIGTWVIPEYQLPIVLVVMLFTVMLALIFKADRQNPGERNTAINGSSAKHLSAILGQLSCCSSSATW
jgi:parallel beta-helix repeat protein